MDQDYLSFWEHHSVNFLTMAFETNRSGRIENPDGYGKCSRECGDTLEIFLNSHDGLISSAYFDTEGCLYTVACANTVVSMVEGKPVEEAWHILPRHIFDYLETLPEAEMHCAELAVQALHAALLDLSKTERQPWVQFCREG